MAEEEGEEKLPCVDHCPLNEGAVGKIENGSIYLRKVIYCTRGLLVGARAF